ncbi:hypothetical protein TNCT_174091 [Trichonephila clavata]|uniref:Uncharacterized protein n=1 Tax=Trichonephila clavata TaxID=2740835 RepID=A0A8X6F186_TRICU|nr:hypothetical protein TNCT_174091 [Trichonephila clavata]
MLTFRSFTTLSSRPGLGSSSADKCPFLKSSCHLKIVDLPKHLSLQASLINFTVSGAVFPKRKQHLMVTPEQKSPMELGQDSETTVKPRLMNPSFGK